MISFEYSGFFPVAGDWHLMLHLLDAIYKLVGPDIISAACKVLQVSLADYTACSVFLRGHHMCALPNSSGSFFR
jgi:hypothetical protein